MTDVLARDLRRRRAAVARQKAAVPLAELERRLARRAGRAASSRALEARLARRPLALIAEIKKASPSKGLIRADFDPPAPRAGLCRGRRRLPLGADRGAAISRAPTAISRRRARAVDLPCLRKDFMLEPYQVVEARALGADCILLIMAALDDRGRGRAARASRATLGMDVLVEVHDAAELERALRLETPA